MWQAISVAIHLYRYLVETHLIGTALTTCQRVGKHSYRTPLNKDTSTRTHMYIILYPKKEAIHMYMYMYIHVYNMKSLIKNTMFSTCTDQPSSQSSEYSKTETRK